MENHHLSVRFNRISSWIGCYYARGWFVSTWSAVIIGLLVSPVCFYAIAIVKHKLGYDDALDAFGCHGVGGIFWWYRNGTVYYPELALDPDNIGLIYGNPRLFLVTIATIVFTIVWSSGMTFVLIKESHSSCHSAFQIEKKQLVWIIQNMVRQFIQHLWA